MASSLGTLFEWYAFYLYGTLAAFFAYPTGVCTLTVLVAGC